MPRDQKGIFLNSNAYSVDYKASAHRKTGANIELSDAVKYPSAVSVDAKKILQVWWGYTRRNADVIIISLNIRFYTWPGGAMVARLTPDHKVAGSNRATGLIFVMVVSKIISFGLGRYMLRLVDKLFQT